MRGGPHSCQEGTRRATWSRSWKASLDLLDLGSCQLGLPSTQHVCRSHLSIQRQVVPEGHFPHTPANKHLSGACSESPGGRDKQKL